MPEFYSLNIGRTPYVITPFFAAAVKAVPTLAHAAAILPYIDAKFDICPLYQELDYSLNFDPDAKRLSFYLEYGAYGLISYMEPDNARDCIDFHEITAPNAGLLPPSEKQLLDITPLPAFLESLSSQPIPPAKLIKLEEDDQDEDMIYSIEANSFLPQNGRADDLKPLAI